MTRDAAGARVPMDERLAARPGLWLCAASVAEAVRFSALNRDNVSVEQTVEVLEDPTARLSAREVLALSSGGANGLPHMNPLVL